MTQCDWELASWPAKKGDEIDSAFFEDIRKRIWLLGHRNAGYVDLLRTYGLYEGTPPDGDFVPYDHDNWVGNWDGYNPPNETAKPGEIMKYFKHDSVEDLFVNYTEMDGDTIDDHPPIDEVTGIIDGNWRLYPNPNLYSHYNRNAGRSEIGASGRWLINHSERSIPGCPIYPYNCRAEAYKFLPQQTDPKKQIAPLKIEGVWQERKSPVEILKKYINQIFGTQYNRSFGDDECTYPEQKEYTKYGAEPPNTSDEDWQYAAELKMCEAYQDQVQLAIEAANEYLKKVDDDFIEVWSWNMTKSASAWDSETSYIRGQVTYVTGAPNIFYICTAPNTNQQPPNTDYWLTPVYQPEYFREHPVYFSMEDHGDITLFTPLWVCNGIIFELALKGMEPESGVPYDWWWDTTHPYVPLWLHNENIAPGGSVNNPLPRGCWRRCWRHSMGRIGDIMWPGDAGDPPGYGDDIVEASKFIITQDDYNAITDEERKKNYRVIAVEALWAAAYSGDEEALIVERHDPVQIHKYKIWNEETQEYDWIEQPIYEIHHDLVNDLRLALQQLILLEIDVFSVRTWQSHKEAYEDTGDPAPQYSSEALAYAAGETACDGMPPPNDNWIWSVWSAIEYYVVGRIVIFTVGGITRLWYCKQNNINQTPTSGGDYWDNFATLVSSWPEPTEKVWMPIGYLGKVRGPCENSPYQFAGCSAYCMGGYGSEKELFFVETTKDESQPSFHLSNVIMRVGYRGITPLEWGTEDGCVVGFDDLTVIASPEAPEKCAYVKAEFADASCFWFYDTDNKWYYICHFNARLISDWPPSPGCGLENEQWQRKTDIDASGMDMDKFIVFEIDWCRALNSIFAEDETNFITL